MRILITTGLYPPEIGGPATYTKLVEAELVRKGHTVKVLPFSLVRKFPTGIRHLVFIWKILSIGKKYDVIYAQDTVSVGFPTLLASKILGKKFFVRVPGDFAWEQGVGRFGVTETIDDFQNKRYGFRVELLRRIQNMVTRNADAVITPSDYFKTLVFGWVRDPKRVHHIYNGISFEDVESFQFSRKTLVASGRLVPWKGFDALISFVATTDFDLVIIGEGDEREKLEALIDEKKLHGKVKLLGKISRQELLSYNKGAFAVIAPSTFESFSFQLVEAMSVGAVCVAFRIGNLDEIITNGVSGYLVPSGDFEAIRHVLDAIPNTREHISQNAIRESRRFSVEHTVEKLLTLFEKKKRLLVISTDRGLFQYDSHVTQRFLQYAEYVDYMDVIVFSRRGFSSKQYGNVSVYPTNSFSPFLYIFDALRIALSLQRPSIVTTQDPFETGVVGFFLSLKSKWNVQIHTDWRNSFFRKNIINKIRVCIAHCILWKAHSIRVVGERIKQSLPNYVRRKKITTLPIFVDMSPTKHEPEEKTSYYLLTVSRLEKEKNIDVLIRAMSSIQNGVLHILGEGSQKDTLMRLVRECNLEDRVIFLGFQKNVSDFYEKADVYLQSSSYEGFGMSLLEAGLHGLPIVTTNVGIVGFELPKECVVVSEHANFSSSIQTILSDISQRRKLSERVYQASQEVKKKMNKSDYYRNYIQGL